MAMVGGNITQPGEICLAYNGVLSLDELPQFKWPALAVLNQPLDEGLEIKIKGLIQSKYI